MAIAYRITQPDGDWSARRKLPLTLEAIRVRAKKAGGPYRLKERGEDKWGPARSLSSTLPILAKKLKNAKVGDVWAISCNQGTDRVVIDIRKIAYKEKIPNTPGTTPIDKIYWEIFRKFNVENWGICNCRHISGSSSWSQHAWCNALDIGGPISELQRVAGYLRENSVRLKTAHILWQVPDHYNHVHVDCHPLGTGTPPCAR